MASQCEEMVENASMFLYFLNKFSMTSGQKNKINNNNNDDDNSDNKKKCNSTVLRTGFAIKYELLFSSPHWCSCGLVSPWHQAIL